MKPNPILIGGLVLLTLLCVFSTFRSCTASDRPDAFYQTVGVRAGEAVGDAMANSGTALLLVRPAIQGEKGMFGVMTDACSAGLEKRGITVVRQELAKIELDDMVSETSVSGERFKEAIAGHDSIEMIVSFVGVPPASIGKSVPPIYVVAAAEAECRSAYDRKKIVGALAMKPWDSLSGQSISEQPAKRFEQTCTMVP